MSHGERAALATVCLVIGLMLQDSSHDMLAMYMYSLAVYVCIKVLWED